MIVLAVDLGETTGYAYVHSVSPPYDSMLTGLIRYGTFKLGEALPKVSIMPDVVVIERPAYIPGAVQERYATAVSYYRGLFKNKVKVIRAADWMQRFANFPLPGRGVLATPHEKDAYRMAHWALDKFGGEVR